jgi:hypothetical protein
MFTSAPHAIFQGILYASEDIATKAEEGGSAERSLLARS